MDRFVVLCSNYAFKSLSQKILKYYYSPVHITLCAFNVSYLVDYKKGATSNISEKGRNIEYNIELCLLQMICFPYYEISRQLESRFLQYILCSISIIIVQGSQPQNFSFMLPRYDGVKFLKLQKIHNNDRKDSSLFLFMFITLILNRAKKTFY